MLELCFLLASTFSRGLSNELGTLSRHLDCRCDLAFRSASSDWTMKNQIEEKTLGSVKIERAVVHTT